MIASCWERISQALIDSFAIVVDEGGLTVDWHQSRNNLAPINIANALVSQAHTKYRDFAAEIAYYIVGNTSFQWSAWSW